MINVLNVYHLSGVETTEYTNNAIDKKRWYYRKPKNNDLS